MAYGHRWYGFIELSEGLRGDIAALMLQATTEISGWNGEGLPELYAQHLRFNGSRRHCEDAEFFALHSGLNDGSCETAAMPYDELACSVLLRVLHYSPQLSIESDGEWGDWQAGRKLYEQVFRELPPRPVQITT